jgi:hypothetical protein
LRLPPLGCVGLADHWRGLIQRSSPRCAIQRELIELPFRLMVGTWRVDLSWN